MPADQPLDEHYRLKGQWLVDALYDKGFLDQNIARESHRSLDVFLGEIVQMEVESALRVDRLRRKLRDRKEDP